MNDELSPNALREKALLKEYRFTSTVPIAGGLITRFRDAWNSVATKWQARPVMEQQTAFNLALIDWLSGGRATGEGIGLYGIESQVTQIDRGNTRLRRDTATVATRARYRPHEGLLRLAYFSPMPPARSGIADYSADLLPYLATRVEVTVFSDDPARPFGGLPLEPTADYPAQRERFDIALYHMGNSAHHDGIYALMMRFPGVVVLHDYFLHHFIVERTIGRGDFTGYLREFGYACGDEGLRLAREIQAKRRTLPLYEIPLNDRVIDGSLAVVVHSEYAANLIRMGHRQAKVAVIPQPVEIRAGRSRRNELGIPDDVVLFAAVGQVTAAKQLPLALRAFRNVLNAGPRAHFLIVGEVLPEVELDAVIAELDLGDHVTRLGHVPSLDAFIDWVATADVVLNLRYPTLGETSNAALRVLAAGRPLIVFDHGWYAELPDDAAVKTPVMNEAALAVAMLAPARSPEERAKLSAGGLRYVAERCRPDRVADAYVSLLEEILRPGEKPA